jgi:hypothetical protein
MDELSRTGMAHVHDEDDAAVTEFVRFLEDALNGVGADEALDDDCIDASSVGMTGNPRVGVVYVRYFEVGD